MNCLLVLIGFLLGLLPSTTANGTCGKSKYPDAGDYFLPSPSIVGGIEARPNEFPWQISIQSKINSHACGGSIINSRWIITAAHCLNRKNPKDFKVTVGLHKKLSGLNDASVRSYEIERFIMHEDFDANVYVKDVGLIKVRTDMKLDENVSAVCAPQSDDEYAHVKSVVSGWGALAYGSNEKVDALRYTTLNTTTNAYCSKRYSGNSVITKDMMCASDNRNSSMRDACQGDSGGPLVVKERDGTFRLVGVVSWGDECASGYPGVYARVNYFEGWILEKIKL